MTPQPVVVRVGLTAASRSLAALIERARSGEVIVITAAGLAVATLVPVASDTDAAAVHDG